jgi:hypothetical protein
VTPPVVVLGLLGATSGSLTTAAAAHVPNNSPGAAATSTCSFDGTGFWWMLLNAPALFYSPSIGAFSAADLSSASGGWPAASQPSACSVTGGALYVLVSGVGGTTATVYEAAPALPTDAAGLAWTAVAALTTPGGAAAGFALSPDALSLFVAASAGGVFRATRAAAGATAFSSFMTNAAAATLPASDVLVSANGLTVYVLTPYLLATVDLRLEWATAPLVNFTTAPADGTAFLGIALRPT